MILEKYKIILLVLIFSTISASISASNDIIYFASLSESDISGKIISSSLYYNPVSKALKTEPFQKVKWNLYTKKTKNIKKIKELGVKAFLIKHGTLSIKSLSLKKKYNIKDLVEASFDGYFLNEIKITKIKNLGKNKIKVSFQAYFAPLSYPEKWDSIILRDKIISNIKYFQSFF